MMRRRHMRKYQNLPLFHWIFTLAHIRQQLHTDDHISDVSPVFQAEITDKVGIGASGYLRIHDHSTKIQPWYETRVQPDWC